MKTSFQEILLNKDQASFTISFTLATAGEVKLDVSDITGRNIATIIDEYREDLNNELIWEGNDLSPSMYLLTMTSGCHRDTRTISVVN